MSTLAEQAAALSEADRRSWVEEGYLALRGFFSREAVERAACAGEADLRRTELICTENIRCRWTDHVET